MILVVDDIEEIAQEHSCILKGLGFENQYLTNPYEVMPYLKKADDIDLICIDLRMPGLSGLDLIAQINNFNPAIGIIVATVVNDVREAVKSIRQGAYNYLIKPLQPESLFKVVQSFYHNQPKCINHKAPFSSFVTQSQEFISIFDKVGIFANSNLPILIHGETGTGKELIARMIHKLSPRKDHIYLPVNISSLKGDLFQAELFGHTKGSFTGADKNRSGFFAQANHGTLFLDEIGELPLDQQKNLLRTLQDGSFYPVGSSQAQQSNCRLIFATNRDLKEEVREGRFREDLYYRICHANISIPPLRERPEDIECLANYFFKKYCSQYGRSISNIHPETFTLLKKYPFYGNVRELEGMISVAVMLETGPLLSERHFPDHIKACHEPISPSFNLEQIRKQTILKALEQTQQNQTKAAELLGISRATLHRFVNEH